MMKEFILSGIGKAKTLLDQLENKIEKPDINHALVEKNSQSGQLPTVGNGYLAPTPKPPPLPPKQSPLPIPPKSPEPPKPISTQDTPITPEQLPLPFIPPEMSKSTTKSPEPSTREDISNMKKLLRQWAKDSGRTYRELKAEIRKKYLSPRETIDCMDVERVEKAIHWIEQNIKAIKRKT